MREFNFVFYFAPPDDIFLTLDNQTITLRNKHKINVEWLEEFKMLHCPMLQLSLVSPTVIYANTERKNINRINKTGWNTFLYLKWETDESPKIVQFKHWAFWTLEFMYSVELYELQGLYGAVLEVKKYVSVLSLFTCRCISWCYSVKKCEKWPNIVRWGVCALQTDLNTNVCPITALKKFISYIWVTKVTIFGQQLLICMTASFLSTCLPIQIMW